MVEQRPCATREMYLIVGSVTVEQWSASGDDDDQTDRQTGNHLFVSGLCCAVTATWR